MRNDGVHPPGGAFAGPDPTDASLLTQLGLSPRESAVYRLLVDRPDSDPDALADLSTGRPAEVARALDILVERGLANADRTDESPPRYRAASPVLALGPLLESRRTALHRVEPSSPTSPSGTAPPRPMPRARPSRCCRVPRRSGADSC
ncbi:TrmB family transcriptional regulator [Streptomyces sp. 6-11-2]|uniref:TrmB family transcriptional regulator n=1 Tax=Streptomyces sp. 6-11-2 TaxID=2585753 RepID=UPI00114178FE|nr:TrmB family transcriptional regulator [Streptomyces sp. 6-11-2]GED89574.1 hypothetical protein TNCT6_66590 [Streptomyces sp. 6-11-2]